MATSERRPGPNWTEIPLPGAFRQSSSATAASMWEYRGTRVISALELAELPTGSGIGPQWHVSVSQSGVLPTQAQVDRALRSFRMVGAEEDNHHPGNARHFWMPVDPAARVDCECKATEVTVETAGYRWTNPKDGDGDCRGCEIAALMRRPCPIHGPARGDGPVDQGAAA